MKPPSPIKLRLNPFVFPSETGSLFALFMVAAILFAIYVGRVLLVVFAREGTQPFRTLDPVSVVRGEALSETLGAMLPYLSVSVLMTFVVFGIAIFIYRGHPNRVRQRKKLQPLLDKDMPLQQAVNELVERAGVLPIPIVEMPLSKQGKGGQAFGFRGNYRIGLGGELRIWQRWKQGWFRAVVLHELAHIAHDDIRRSYFAEALWVAMIVAGLAPLMVGLMGSFVQGVAAGLQNDDNGISSGVLIQPLLALLRLFLQAGITLVVIAAIRASLLRTRELYADWRAALWGAEDALKELFMESGEGGKMSLTPAILKLHPTPSERLAVLNQPNQLFRLPWQLPFIVGFLSISILAGIFALAPPLLILILEPFRASRIWLGEIYQTTPNLVNGILFWGVRSLWFVLFVAGIVGFLAPIVWLLSGVLGTQSQKQALLDLAEGRRGATGYLKLGIPAIVYSFGMEIGALVIVSAKLA